MKKSTVYITTAIIIIIFFILVMDDFVVKHEELHKTIYSHYGINSTIQYDWTGKNGWFGQTTGIDGANKCTNECKLAQEQNEIVGYNNMTLIITIFIITLAYFLSKAFVSLGEE